MEDQRFKTMRHIETVRNFISLCVTALLSRSVEHDQSKLQSPEREVFDEYTPLLRGVTYLSTDYKDMMIKMKPAIDHHNAHNRHHPEHYKNGIKDMTLIDILEMLCDWKAASLRHNDGNLLKSIEVNQERFGYSEDLRRILENTAKFLDASSAPHHASES